ncbi:MAG: hypothetical protein ABR536_02890 [Solirubrobacterales bacterium]
MRHRHRSNARHAAAPVAFLALALLAGCGGGSGGSQDLGATTGATDSGSAIVTTAPAVTAAPAAPTAGVARSDESLIRGAITAVFVSGDPAAACDKAATRNYVVSAFGDLSGCRAAQRSGAAAKAVTMSGIAVEGDTARAVAVPTGGPSAGQRIELTLVKDGTSWKVDTASSDVPVGP